MSLALGLVLLGLLLVYAGVKGKSVSSLLLGDATTPSQKPSSVDRTGNSGASTGTNVPASTTGNKGSPGGGLAEAFYDPLGSYDNGKFGGPIGGHSTHVHLSITEPNLMLRAIAVAQAMGLHVGENPYVGNVSPVHVDNSYHYRTFPGTYNGRQLGQAIDVTGNPSLMARFYVLATTGKL